MGTKFSPKCPYNKTEGNLAQMRRLHDESRRKQNHRKEDATLLALKMEGETKRQEMQVSTSTWKRQGKASFSRAFRGNVALLTP